MPAGGLPGGINPVTRTSTFESDQSGLGVNWQWTAANYTSFSSDYSTLGVKPVDDNNLSSYLNSDHAGAPENFTSYVVGGARGGGGSNFTGSLSATTSPPIQGLGQLTIITKESPNLQTRSDTAYDVQASYSVPSPLTDKLYLTRTWQGRSPSNVFDQSTQDTNSPYTYSVPLLGIAVNQDLGNFSPVVQYGLETWTLSYAPTDGNSPPVVRDVKQVLIYPKSTSTISDALTLGSNPTALNAKSYQGDTPRVAVQIVDSYPGGNLGLFSGERELYGVACFGHGPAGKIRQLIGEPALCLERGASVHYAPRNSASFLITHSTRLLYRILGVARFFAYADPMAGEYGAVYQAANWLYLGQGLDGRNGRGRRYFVLPPGANPFDPSCWRTTRDLRRANRKLSFAEARAFGYQIASREAKHVYAVHVGTDRRNWRKTLKVLPYPAPCPELKRVA